MGAFGYNQVIISVSSLQPTTSPMIDEKTAKQHLQRLLDDFHNLTDIDRQQMSEASVIHQFINRLLEEVLGWPIKDKDRCKYELHTQAGRPDITLFPENGGAVFVEAKRFGVIKELEQAKRDISGIVKPGQLALPGMAADRTAEEQQAINYAFANGGTWAILTNFEKLRLCTRPEFAELWQAVMQTPLSVYGEGQGVGSNERQRLRDEIDALVAHLYGLSRDEFAHILTTFPLVFPSNAEGEAKKARLLSVYATITS